MATRKSERELLQEYDTVRSSMQELLTTAADEERAFYTDEKEGADGHINERAIFTELEEQGENLKVRIGQERSHRAIELELLPGQTPDPVVPAAAAGEPGGDGAERADAVVIEKRTAAFRSYIRTGRDHEYREAMRATGVEERAGATNPMVGDDDTYGGFVQAPPEFVPEIIKDLDLDVAMRRPGMATARQIGQAVSLGYPKMTSKMSGAVHGSEVGDIPEMTAPKFGRREWFPRPITGWFALSNDLIRRAVLPAEELVRAEIRRVVGEQEEEDFLTGSGQPGISLGVFTASALGISTARDFSAGNTTTEIKIKGLKKAKHGLKRGYHPFARWLLSSDAVEQVDQITDGAGRPIWNENIRDADGNPRLLGFPVEISDFVPNTFTTGLYVGMLGDFRQYLIAESLLIEIKRLDELKALNNLTIFLVRVEVDGMPKLEEAFSRVKLA